jgi:ribonuclease D
LDPSYRSTAADLRPLTRGEDVRTVADDIRALGVCALDLEFVSESRYVPELGLVQVAWGDPETPRVVAADPLATDVEPLLGLVSDPGVEVAIHAFQGDLALISDRFGLEAQAVVDTQVAAAFLGVGDQVGFTTLVERTVGVELDKGAQFTDWLRRPLTDEQLRYALADVRYLLPAWAELRRRLADRGRLDWVREESERLARAAARRRPPEETFRKIGGWNRLDPRQLGALRALAAWREEEALSSNTPPAWLLPDRTVLELARRRPTDRNRLRRVRGVKAGVAHRHGSAILEALARGADDPADPERPPRRLTGQGRTWASLLSGLIQARCREQEVAPRFVGARADAEALVRWWIEGDREREPDLPLLTGWRREMVGEEALAWLAGDIALAADAEAKSGVRVVGGS